MSAYVHPDSCQKNFTVTTLQTRGAAASSGTGVTVGMWSNFKCCCVAAWVADGMLEVATEAALIHINPSLLPTTITDEI
jgi:hypothetical protein